MNIKCALEKIKDIVENHNKYSLLDFEDAIDEYLYLNNRSNLLEKDEQLMLITFNNLLYQLQKMDALNKWSVCKQDSLLSEVKGIVNNKVFNRKIYWPRSMPKEVMKFSNDLLIELENFITKLKFSSDEELIETLMLHQYELISTKGSNVYSVRMLRIPRHFSHHRLIFTFGKYMPNLKSDDNSRFDFDSIYLLDYMTDHHYRKMAINLGLINKSFVAANFKNIGVPNLMENQHKITKISHEPVQIIGTAGSGKTSIAVMSFYEWVKNNELSLDDKKYAFITYNKKLKNIISSQVGDFIKNQSDNILTIREFYNKVLNENYQEEDEQKEFYDWFNKKYGSKSHSGYLINKISNYFKGFNADEILYSIYRGLYKGYFSDLNNLGNNNYKCYKESLNTYKINFDENIKIFSYELFQDFDKYLSTKDNFHSNNDLALKALSNIKVKFDFIVVDEVQDLSKIEIYALVNSSKNGEIFFFGDPFQTINPTIFSTSFIDSAYIELGINSKFNNHKHLKYNLSKTFRAGDSLINTLNNIIDLRVDNLGMSDNFDVKVERTSLGLDVSLAPLLIYNKKQEIDVIKKAMKYNNVGIIFPNEKLKKEFNAKYNTKAFNNKLYTIYESKGLEFNVVILYNFITNDKNKYIEMISDDNINKYSFLNRLIFNKWFVANSRAINYLIAIESENLFETKEDSKLRDYFKGYKKYDKQAIEIIFEEELTPFDFYYKGYNFFNNNEYKLAIQYLEKGIEHNEHEAKKLIELSKQLIKLDLNSNVILERRFIEDLKSFKKYNLLTKLHEDNFKEQEILFIKMFYTEELPKSYNAIKQLIETYEFSYNDYEHLLIVGYLDVINEEKQNVINKMSKIF